jgi:ubiquinone/menaquinone biosynthesis C-methylase UbiE
MQIVLFNWPYYVIAALAGVTAITLPPLLPMSPVVRVLVGLGAGVAFFWLVGSLAVSYYVYDHSPLYKWEWVSALFPSKPRRWANIHAGFDETSAALRRLFPEGESTILDIYSPTEMTEPSIERARHRTPAVPSAQAEVGSLPFGDGDLDAVFLIFTAHEIRDPDSRLRFFHELHRVLRTNGKLLLVEHLRDWLNLLAFGPGVLHFLPRREWVRLARKSGFVVADELSMTPFVRVFVLEKGA